MLPRESNRIKVASADAASTRPINHQRKNMNPNQVPISLTLNVDQINVILEGLGNLPFARVEALYTGIRNHAIQRLKEAEQEALAFSEPADETKDEVVE